MLTLTPIPMCYLLVPMNGTLLFWTTPTLPPLVTPPGDPTWAPDPSLHGFHDPRIDEFGNFKGRVHHILISNLAQHKHAITPQPIDFEKLRPYFSGSINTPLRNPSTKPLNGLLLPLGTP